MLQTRKSFKAICIALVILGLSSASPVLAATLTVTNLNDSGPGSLRDAIATASPGDTIVFGATGTITLTSGELLINKNLTISGPGAASLAISGNNTSPPFTTPNGSRVFNINGAFTVAISGVTIENGSSVGADGGGIFSNGGTLTVNNSTFSGNITGSAGFSGGGIAFSGTLTVTNSTFSNNFSPGGGGIFISSGTVTVTSTTFLHNLSGVAAGGIFNRSGTLTVTSSTFAENASAFDGGGIVNTLGTLTVTNSTFSNNSVASGRGGGILNLFSGTLRVANSTFSGNSSVTGGAIYSGGSTAILKNTLLANSSLGGNCGGATSITSQGYNLSDDGTCAAFFNQTGDKNNTAAGLDPGGLKNNGGPTQTIALLATSPAVDAIPLSPVNFCTDVAGNPVSTDQRGVTRPQGPACDIGAFELEQVSSTTTTLTSSANPSVLGQLVTFTATVSPAGATGTVTFQDGATTLGTAPLTSGHAIFSTSSLAVGSHSITAQYSGGGSFSASSGSLTQTVAYGICALYDQTRSVNSGAVYPIKVALCNANGTDVSSSAVVLHATAVTKVSAFVGTPDSPGNANPDNDFRFDSTLGTTGGYIFNLSTSGLASGTYRLQFTATGDPVSHSVNFGVN